MDESLEAMGEFTQPIRAITSPWADDSAPALKPPLPFQPAARDRVSDAPPSHGPATIHSATFGGPLSSTGFGLRLGAQGPLPPPSPPPPRPSPPPEPPGLGSVWTAWAHGSLPPPSTGTIGQNLALNRPPSDVPPPMPVEVPAAPLPAASLPAKRRPVELLWAAENATSAVRTALPQQFTELTQGSVELTPAELRLAVHRHIAKSTPVEDAEKTLWDAVDEDGVFTPPVVVLAGRLELQFERVDYLKTLVGLVEPHTEGSAAGEVAERLMRTLDTAPEAESLIAKAFSDLKNVWDDDELVPLSDLEGDAVRLLIAKRKYRTIDIFGSVHLVAYLETDAHPNSIPVYLPEAARGRLPLEHRFDAKILTRLCPRQMAEEDCSIAVEGLGVARILPSR